MKFYIACLFFCLALSLVRCGPDHKKELVCNEVNEDVFMCLGYEWSEVDTIKINLYKKNTDFSSLQNSMAVYPEKDPIEEAAHRTHFHINNGISTINDWEIILSNGDIFRFSNFEILKTQVYDGDLTDVCIIESMTLNGENHEGSLVLKKK